MPQAIPYTASPLIHLLALSSFLYLINVVRAAADFAFYAGIVAEISFGIIYGSPLANLLPNEWEITFTAVGYLGLILVVFEGGLSTNLPLLLANLPLSLVCALTGIGLPIAFSFALLNTGFGYRPLEAFAAGAALSSTSLGTTLAALSSVTRNQNSDSAAKPVGLGLSSDPLDSSTDTGMSAPCPAPPLQQSRIGTVLISAAIIDDVIGLVIASLIPALASVNSGPTLGQTSRGSLAWTIVRPLLSSCLVAGGACVVARYALRPLFWYRSIGERWCAPARAGKPWGALGLAREGAGWGTEAHADAVKLFIMVATVSAMAAITNYVGASVLYGAYVAGLVLSYVARPVLANHPSADSSGGSSTRDRDSDALSFEQAFARMIGPLQNHLLLPLFFASIGFAIPFLDLWHPTIFWRGIVYSVLMCIAKLAVGIPILVYPAISSFMRGISTHTRRLWHVLRTRAPERMTAALPGRFRRKPTVTDKPLAQVQNPNSDRDSNNPDSRGLSLSTDNVPVDEETRSTWRQTLESAHPALFMGAAMVSRGEIGLLIAQLARGDPSSPGQPGLLGDEAFAVCIWAILVCTLIGPTSVGVVVRRWGAKVTAGRWA